MVRSLGNRLAEAAGGAHPFFPIQNNSFRLYTGDKEEHKSLTSEVLLEDRQKSGQRKSDA